jgi:hypothetical protein
MANGEAGGLTVGDPPKEFHSFENQLSVEHDGAADHWIFRKNFASA